MSRHQHPFSPAPSPAIPANVDAASGNQASTTSSPRTRVSSVSDLRLPCASERLALALVVALLLPTAAIAQDHSQHQATTDEHAGHQPIDHDPEPSLQAEAVDHAAMGHTVPVQKGAAGAGGVEIDHTGMDHGSMDHADADAPTESIEPIPTITDADRAAAFPPLQHHMQHASEINHFVLFNRLEAFDGDHGRGEAWEGQAWIGGDLNRLWLRSEGERAGGHTESADLEVLYGRSVSPWWDVVAGLRHDFKPGPPQTWAAFGVQGLAPYMLEVSATAYVGKSGRTAANIEVEYELLLTNRLILQPLLEADIHGKDDPQRGIGSGLSTVEAGLRLRYEFTRRFAPYIGVVHERALGGTADLRRAAGEPTDDSFVVAGIRFWF